MQLLLIYIVINIYTRPTFVPSLNTIGYTHNKGSQKIINFFSHNMEFQVSVYLKASELYVLSYIFQ